MCSNVFKCVSRSSKCVGTSRLPLSVFLSRLVRLPFIHVRVCCSVLQRLAVCCTWILDVQHWNTHTHSAHSHTHTYKLIHTDVIVWFWKLGWLNHTCTSKQVKCALIDLKLGLGPLWIDLKVPCESLPTSRTCQLVRKIGSQNQSISVPHVIFPWYIVLKHTHTHRTHSLSHTHTHTAHTHTTHTRTYALIRADAICVLVKNLWRYLVLSPASSWYPLLCVAACCSVLQCVVVCCSVL